VVAASSYLTIGILSLAIPLGVLGLVGIYWAIVVRRHPEEF
jgi:hypothetical protein